MKEICFDMDGTIADLFGVPDWLALIRSENPVPYLLAKPLWDMNSLRGVLLRMTENGWTIKIISWLAKDSSQEYCDLVCAAKKWWLRTNNFPVDDENIHLIAYGVDKSTMVKKLSDTDKLILVDDNKEVRKSWTVGRTINPQEVNLIEELEKLVRE